MATRGNFISNTLPNQENLIEGKKLDMAVQKLPMRRPALGDVGNRIVNQIKVNNEEVKIFAKPTLKGIQTKDAKKISNDSVPKQTIKKPLKREDSIMKGLIGLSSKQLNIYDPDEGSKNDPNAVTEYLDDIFSHLRAMEAKYAIENDFLDNHQTKSSMRAVLINWLVDLQISFKLCIESLHLCVGLVDRYLQAKKDVGRETLQLVGATALMVAAKYEEVYTPELNDFVYVCDDAFTAKQMLAMERDILVTLNFYLGRPSSIHFLRRYSKIAMVTSLQHSLAKYLLELALLDHSMSHILPSHQAAAACCLSIGIMAEEMDLNKIWSPTMVYYTTYKLSDFRHVIVMFAKLLLKIEKSKHQIVTQKYSASTHGKISTHYKLKGRLVMKLAAETPVKK